MKLNYKRTILIGLAFLSISAFWQMYDNIIPLILTNSFELGDTFTGVIMAADNVIALFLLPLFGTLSDKVDTKIGKRMPFILIGTTLASIFLFILPMADNARNLPLFIIVLLLLLLSMGFYRSPAVALMPDLTPKPLRSKGNAIINLMGAVGGVITLLLIKMLVGSGITPNYQPLFTALIVLMVTCIVILFITIKENKLRATIHEEKEEITETKEVTVLSKDENKSLSFLLLSVALWFIAYNAVTSAFSRYATAVWGLENGGYANCLMIATVAAIISYLPIGMISSKIGRKKTILIGIILLAACFFIAGLYGQYHWSMIIFFGIIGFAWAAIGVNSLPMVLEIASDADVGKYTGYYYTFSMSAQIVTPILSGFLLEHVSYRTLFPYSFIFSILAFITMSMVKHGDVKPMAKKDILESFDVED
ncbi:MAG: MFS transporter [Bacilli bacterium]|nr:MFS transporter [Bacilli bacterium]